MVGLYVYKSYRFGKGNKSKSSATLRITINHDYGINDGTVLLKEVEKFGIGNCKDIKSVRFGTCGEKPISGMTYQWQEDPLQTTSSHHDDVPVS